MCGMEGVEVGDARWTSWFSNPLPGPDWLSRPQRQLPLCLIWRKGEWVELVSSGHIARLLAHMLSSVPPQSAQKPDWLLHYSPDTFFCSSWTLTHISTHLPALMVNRTAPSSSFPGLQPLPSMALFSLPYSMLRPNPLFPLFRNLEPSLPNPAKRAREPDKNEKFAEGRHLDSITPQWPAWYSYLSSYRVRKQNCGLRPSYLHTLQSFWVLIWLHAPKPHFLHQAAAKGYAPAQASPTLTTPQG